LRADHQSYVPALEQAASKVLMHYLENLRLK